MARIWFTDKNTSGLLKQDLHILNSATRHLSKDGHVITRELLSVLRVKYRIGMSSRDLIESYEDDGVR